MKRHASLLYPRLEQEFLNLGLVKARDILWMVATSASHTVQKPKQMMQIPSAMVSTMVSWRQWHLLLSLRQTLVKAPAIFSLPTDMAKGPGGSAFWWKKLPGPPWEGGYVLKNRFVRIKYTSASSPASSKDAHLGCRNDPCKKFNLLGV